MSGRTIGADKIPIAVVKVQDVEHGRSSAVIVPNGGDKKLIRRGDKVEPISSKKAKQLSDGKKFVKSRPKEQSDAYSLLLAGDAAPPGSPPQVPVVNTPPERPPQAPAVNTPPAQLFSERNDVEGVDRNSETGFKLIDTYPLEEADKNNLGIAHRGARNLYSQEKYKEAFDAFTRLATDYKCDYLSAYWAGMSAMQMNNGREAMGWFNKVLEVNPDYKPALDARAKVG
jgi:TolA-binding protein